MKDMKIRVTFIEELLGTAPNSKEIYKDFIASKSEDAATIEDEIAAVGIDETLEKGTTVFPRTEDGKPFLYDYQWKGYFKETASFMRKIPGTATSKVKAFKKQIDGLIFINERQCVIEPSGEITLCQRPLRAQTPQGERVSLACSETIPAMSNSTFTIHLMVDSDEKLIEEWLDYGYYHGTGQWRNSGKGKFVWELLDEENDDAVIGGNYSKHIK